jgi:hypothetical protein
LYLIFFTEKEVRRKEKKGEGGRKGENKRRGM